MTADQLRTLANGEEVRGRICNKEFEVTPDHKAYMSEFLRRWDPPAHNPNVGAAGTEPVEGSDREDPQPKEVGQEGPQCYKWQSDYEECLDEYKD
jgi:hypothetical protein